MDHPYKSSSRINMNIFVVGSLERLEERNLEKEKKESNWKWEKQRKNKSQ